MERILIIDDDDRLRAVMRMTLEEAGYEVIEASDGESGIEMYRTHDPSLAIVDIIMPGKDGVTTIGEIHLEFPSAKLIAISGGDPRNPTSNLSIAWMYGAAVSVQKPFDPGQLVKVVRELLDAPAQ